MTTSHVRQDWISRHIRRWNLRLPPKMRFQKTEYQPATYLCNQYFRLCVPRVPFWERRLPMLSTFTQRIQAVQRLHIRDSGFVLPYRQLEPLMRWNIALEYSTADLVLDRTN